VGDAGITVDPYNVNMLASAMRDVITNSELRENMIEQGKDRAKMFNWESTARKTLSVYEETLP
ncbi:MAG: glycosyltransferase family 1 protein, partial [Sphaerochaetaceae bacterium]|nr:glycosyltransferase family 1 protein [Sphaerochaetaceae bacterium]